MVGKTNSREMAPDADVPAHAARRAAARSSAEERDS